jgi:1,4-alpha-glucan branching enzyme
MSTAYLDNNPSAIWERTPGFYKEGKYWYAIIHAPNSVGRVRLIGDFTAKSSNPDSIDTMKKYAVELTNTPDGKFWWFKGTNNSFHRVPKNGDRYKFIFDEDSYFQDPAARWVEHSGENAYSKVLINDYEWSSTNWERPGWEYYMIYQLHPLRFTSRNREKSPFLELIEELDGDGYNDYLNDLNFTAIEFLPLNEFPGDENWGYDPAFYYSIESKYGSPNEFKILIDTAHKKGKAVIMDLVYNHASNRDNILYTIDKETYFKGDTKWGAMINFKNDIARHFFIQNILYLAKEFKVDGFRFDATRVMHVDDGNYYGDLINEPGVNGWYFLREIREKVKQYDSRIILFAEELPNDWYLTSENVQSSWAGDFHGPFDSQWCDPFHDNFVDVLAGGHLDKLKNVFTYFGDSWCDAVQYTSSHDEVGNEDRRIAKIARDGKGWEMCQIAAAGTFLSRGIPMSFMGQEGGESRQFHIHWWNDRIPIQEYEDDYGKSKVKDWFQNIIDIRKTSLDIFAKSTIDIVHIHDENGIVAFTRDYGKYLIVLNFRGKGWYRYNVGVSGFYQEIANTSWPQFRLDYNRPEVSRKGYFPYYIDKVPIPAYGAVVLVRWD